VPFRTLLKGSGIKIPDPEFPQRFSHSQQLPFIIAFFVLQRILASNFPLSGFPDQNGSRGESDSPNSANDLPDHGQS
jgi:hypothetical protein